MAIEVRLELSFTLELTAIDETEEKGLFTTHQQQNYTIIKYRYCGTVQIKNTFKFYQTKEHQTNYKRPTFNVN